MNAQWTYVYNLEETKIILFGSQVSSIFLFIRYNSYIDMRN